MNASKLKTKSLEQKQSQQSARGSQAKEVTQSFQELGEQMAFWRAEIESLRGLKFSRIEEAFSEIADRVLDRMGSPKANRVDEKKLIVDLFATDPKLQEEIRSILKIS